MSTTLADLHFDDLICKLGAPSEAVDQARFANWGKIQIGSCLRLMPAEWQEAMGHPIIDGRFWNEEMDGALGHIGVVIGKEEETGYVLWLQVNTTPTVPERHEGDQEWPHWLSIDSTTEPLRGTGKIQLHFARNRDGKRWERLQGKRRWLYTSELYAVRYIHFDFTAELRLEYSSMRSLAWYMREKEELEEWDDEKIPQDEKMKLLEMAKEAEEKNWVSRQHLSR
ncbi:hypothetical protein NA57DRAFT_62416 [Rhizodiscina lignyota]|uniref:Uncharacterized protein n=1 Tax=Rhizodiscina lignyota TaxID=1504668 RepID=A0A9P4I2Q7_9PEZI|nr:hypothetical protein NA57DRAFT_62416 [Rhizodiscina lignyota]